MRATSALPPLQLEKEDTTVKGNSFGIGFLQPREDDKLAFGSPPLHAPVHTTMTLSASAGESNKRRGKEATGT